MIKIYNISFLILAFCSISVFAQRTYETNPDAKRANVWYFGQNAGINFNTNPPTALTDGKVNTWEGSASICDTSGNLLFYTDGRTVWNKNHDTIENGFGLLGGLSSTQSATIVNHKLNDSLYYIFTTPNATQTNIGLNLNIVNLKQNNGNGKLIAKNINILSNSCEKLAVINHLNNNDLWILSHEWNSNRFYSFLVTDKNINLHCPIISSTGALLQTQFGSLNATGQLKFSNNASFVANTFVMNKQTELFKFNNETGVLIFWKSINHTRQPYGVEFSPNDSLLYITEQSIDSNFFYQYNIFNNSKVLIAKSKFKDIQAIQGCVNKKIIIAENDSSYLYIVNKPNIIGLDCDYNKLNINLNPNKSSYGLPSFNQSYFYIPSINFSYQLNCINNSITFKGQDTFFANIHTWRIKKLNTQEETSYFTKYIKHTFVDIGKYEIRYIVQRGIRVDTITKQIELYPKINKNFLGNDTVYEAGIPFNKILKAPENIHCQSWYYQDTLRSSTPSYSATQKGTYICKVTSKAFCEVWDTIVINECINNLQEPSLFRTRDTLRTWHINADSFVWYRNNQFYKVTKQPFLALIDTGTYRVEAAKKGHCNSKSIGSNYVQKLNITKFNDYDFRIYPNPTDGNLNIDIDNHQIFVVRLFDNIGKLVLEKNINSNHTIINLDILNSGIYTLSISNANFIINKKIIKQ